MIKIGDYPTAVPFFRQLLMIYDNKTEKILYFCLEILGMKVAKMYNSYVRKEMNK